MDENSGAKLSLRREVRRSRRACRRDVTKGMNGSWKGDDGIERDSDGNIVLYEDQGRERTHRQLSATSLGLESRSSDFGGGA